MKPIIRFVGSKGQTTIPYDIRTELEIMPNDIIRYRIERGEIIITPIHNNLDRDLANESYFMSDEQFERFLELIDYLSPRERDELISYLSDETY